LTHTQQKLLSPERRSFVRLSLSFFLSFFRSFQRKRQNGKKAKRFEKKIVTLGPGPARSLARSLARYRCFQ
jgi:hypothetical protein